RSRHDGVSEDRDGSRNRRHCVPPAFVRTHTRPELAVVSRFRGAILQLILVSLERALPAFLFKCVLTLWGPRQKFGAVGADQLPKKHSVGTGVSGIAGDRHSLTGFDRL